MPLRHLHNPVRTRTSLALFHEQSHICVPLRRFQTSPTCSDDKETLDPLPSRSQRNEDALRDVRELFRRSQVKAQAQARFKDSGGFRRLPLQGSTGAPAEGGVIDARSTAQAQRIKGSGDFRRLPLRGSTGAPAEGGGPDARSAVQAQRVKGSGDFRRLPLQGSTGAPAEGGVIDARPAAQTQRIKGSGDFRRLPLRGSTGAPAEGGAIDARSLASTPPSDKAPGFTIRRVDFPFPAGGAATENQSPDAVRRPERTPGFTIRREVVDSRGPRSRSRAAPTSGSFRTDKAVRSGQQRSGRKPERGARRTTGGRGANKAQERDFREMMKTYELEQQIANAPQPVGFDPTTPDRIGLAEYGPALGSGEFGMRDILAQKQKEVELYWRNKVQINRYQVFDSARSKAHLQSITDGFDASDYVNASFSAKKVGTEDVTADDSAMSPEVLNTLLSGVYTSTRPGLGGQQQDVMSLVGRQAARNASYAELDEASLMARVGQIAAPTPRR